MALWSTRYGWVLVLYLFGKKSGVGASLINNNVWTPYVFDSDICYLSSSHCKKRTESCCSAHVTTKSLRQKANFSHMKCRRILSAVTCIAVQLFLRCISLAAGLLLEHLMLHQSLFHLGLAVKTMSQLCQVCGVKLAQITIPGFSCRHDARIIFFSQAPDKNNLAN